MIGCDYASHTEHQKKSAREAKKYPEYMQYFDTTWAYNPIWDDGLAEVTTMTGESVVYGKSRKYVATLIIVKEVFNRKYNVKTDDYNRDDLTTVFKFNLAKTIQTDIYPYHYLTSTFFERKNPVAIYKCTQGSQEWCGNTFKLFERIDDSLRYTFHSYWDGEGSGTKVLADAVLEHQLLFTLRSLRFKNGLRFTLPIIPNIITNKTFINRPIQTSVQIVEEENVWKVHLDSESAEIRATYSFAKKYPNELLYYEKNDGSKLYDAHTKRYAYWQ